MHGGQRGRRVHPEPLGEQPPGVLVHGQRVALPPGQVEHAHELAAQPLPERVRGGEFPGFRRQFRTPAEGQVRVDPVLGRGQPQFLQPGHRPGCERGVLHIHQRRAAPQGQGLAQQHGAAGRVGGGQGRAALTDQPLELGGVHLSRFHGQPVAARPVLDDGRPGHVPQPGHQGLERVAGVGRAAPVLAVTGPQVPGQPLRRDRASRVQGQPDQQCTQPRAAQLHELPGFVAHFQRAQDADPHCPPPAAIVPVPGEFPGAAIVPVPGGCERQRRPGAGINTGTGGFTRYG